ncbi:MAG: serine/threonine-protein kinase [Caldimonas sp.]
MARIDNARWAILSRWLDELLDTDPGQRAARLEEIRRADGLLAGELASLLAYETAANREAFLEGSAIDAGPTLAGQAIGSYVLDRPIGQGGMGSVWLAHRSDGRFQGQVAFKFLNLALLGERGGARFQREGEILARLAHPNIARLLDAGVATGGQPYLVLEYVDGEPIDRWCVARALDVEARVRLFLDVLVAVAHAHSRLILHRDLKPSNILVAGDGQVKLLDFGIARLLQDSGVDRSDVLNEATARAFTPDYAAPEQVNGEELSTATDVYALGVLFYVLLAGCHPTARGARNPVERLQAVLSTVPARMSDAARSDGPGDGEPGADPAAARRGRVLRGDLDTIAAKALKKVPDERYATAAEMADDLRRWLDHLPIGARADSYAYRTRKFVRRHRAGVAAAAAVALALVAGLGGTAWQAVEAERQRDRALVQLQRAETASEFVDTMLYTTWGADERLTLEEFLGRSEQLALRQLDRQPEQQAVVLHSLGSYYASLGNYAKAEPLLQRAAGILGPSVEPSFRARVECNYASVIGQRGQAEAARITLSRWIADRNIEPAVASQCAMYEAQIAQTLNDAPAALAAALAAQTLLGKGPLRPPSLVASLHAELGYGYEMNDRFEDAEREYAQAIRAYDALGQGDSASAVAILNNWSLVSFRVGDTRRALDMIERTIALAGQRGTTQVVPPYAASNRAGALLTLGRNPDALAAADRAIAIAEKASAPGFIYNSLLTRAGAQAALGDFASADRSLAEAEAIAKTLPEGSFDRNGLFVRRSRVELLRGRPDAARAAIEPLVQRLEAAPKKSASLADALRLRAESLVALGDSAAALRDVDEALVISERLRGSRPHSLRTGHLWLVAARARAQAGDADAARVAAERARAHLDAMLDDDNADRQLAHRLAGG